MAQQMPAVAGPTAAGGDVFRSISTRPHPNGPAGPQPGRG